MVREISLPQAPPLPDKLPFEDRVDALLDRAAEGLERNPITRMAQKIEAQLPVVTEMEFPTPLGTFRLPRLELPSLTPPKMDSRRKEVVKAAVADDLASLVEKVPYVGLIAGPLADFLEDTAMAKLRENLRPEEVESFYHFDKVSPVTTLAALRTFVKHRGVGR